MKNIESYIRLKRTCGNVEAKNRNIVLALAFTESSLDYNAKHSLKDVVGICGINKKFHKDKLDDLGVDINSLKSCEVIYNDYLEQYKGNKVKALIAYKGIVDKSNIYLVHKVLEIEKEIKSK